MYDTLHDAADEYAASGFITVDTLQKICSWGVQYLGYLKDENGQLVINEEGIQNVIAARTEQMAIETALAYVQQIRNARDNNDIATLANLTLATETAANATWDMVYAQLRLMNLSGELNDTMYAGALNNVNHLRALSDIAISGIGQASDSIKEANETAKDALDDLLKYVEDMIKQEVRNQVEALQDQVDKMQEFVSLQKESLDLEKEKDEYTKSVTEKEKAIADLRKKIAALDLDDSREAAAEKAELQEELTDKLNELSDYQSDHAYDAASEMLSDMEEAYKKEKNKEIEILENSISSEEKLYRMALKRIEAEGENLKNQLIAWNTEYGNVVNSEITEAWEVASEAVNKYGSYLNAVLETQKQLAAYESNRDSESPDFNTVVGKTEEYDTSGGTALTATIIDEMKANSDKWWRVKDNPEAIKDVEAHQQNLANQLRKALPGMNIERKRNGTWYINGEELYKSKYATYHTGGIAGDNPTLKQKEIMAKLETGEAIIPEEQQDGLFKILDYQETMFAKYRKLFKSASTANLFESRMNDQIKRDSQQAQNIVDNSNSSITVTVPVQVYPLQKLDSAEVKKLTRDISQHTITEINDSLIKRGKRRTSNPLKP